LWNYTLDNATPTLAASFGGSRGEHPGVAVEEGNMEWVPLPRMLVDGYGRRKLGLQAV